MRLKVTPQLALCLISLLMLSQPLLADQAKEKAAIEAMEEWLSLVDDGSI